MTVDPKYGKPKKVCTVRVRFCACLRNKEAKCSLIRAATGCLVRFLAINENTVPTKIVLSDHTWRCPTSFVCGFRLPFRFQRGLHQGRSQCPRDKAFDLTPLLQRNLHTWRKKEKSKKNSRIHLVPISVCR